MVPCFNFEIKYFSKNLKYSPSETTTNSKTKVSATDRIFFTNDFIQIAIKNKNIYSVLRLMIYWVYMWVKMFIQRRHQIANLVYDLQNTNVRWL